METNEPIELSAKEKNKVYDKLTSVEMGKLWATYMGNSMSVCVLSYYLKHVEDEEINNVLETVLNLSTAILQDITKLFTEENFPIPVGFNDKDVNLGAPRLFEDQFYLHYLRYAGKAGLSLYSTAVPLVVRKDVRDFFIKTLDLTVKLLSKVNDILFAEGFLMKPPPIPVPEKVDFIQKQTYLNGFFGNVRPLHALEITDLYDNIDNDTTSKALLIGFSQTANTEKVREFMLRGIEIAKKHIEACSQHLQKDHLPAPPLLDHLVSTSTAAPFSDKLMLFHKIDMFSMKIRTYANGASLNGRRDIGGMYARFLMDVGLFVEDGANIMIEQGWMEQPPGAVDRNQLASK
ncbi:DUF3231 family protein [Neobacillus sp. SM06]|uniref:DUF3231 family protein n=1 Tax=Neobacillus sp. SM06 TaxID=3422492 RepID=UPI003D2AB9AB